LASPGAQPVSTTPVANFATSFPSVLDTGGKFGKYGNNITLQTPKSELENKNLYLC
jgi:hypothetical protein